MYLVLASIGLVSTLVFPAVASYSATYISLGAGLAGLLLARKDIIVFLKSPAYLGVLLATLGMILPLPFVWHSPDDLIGLLILIPMLLAPGLSYLTVRAGLARPGIIGGMALSGCVAAVGFGFYDILALHLPRAGVGNNPVHYAALSVILGFLALVGLFDEDRRFRIVFLTGPVFALVATILSGTRGALLAVLALSILLLPLLLVWLWRDRWLRTAILAGTAVAIVAVILGSLFFQDRALDLFDTVSEAMQGQAFGDSTTIRMTFWDAARAAFFDSPWIGHGAGQLFSAAAAHFPPGFAQHFDIGSVHLHADLADFAVVGGIVGLLTYAVLLITPLLAIIGLPKGRRRQAVVVGALVGSVGYAVLGLSNALIGILPQTVLYGTIVGLLMALAKSDKDVKPSED